MTSLIPTGFLGAAAVGLLFNRLVLRLEVTSRVPKPAHLLCYRSRGGRGALTPNRPSCNCQI
jgi:hypothetical protein